MTRILHRTTRARHEIACKGEGLLLTLETGAQVIDGSGGAAVACIGHGNRRVAEAIGAQAARVAYIHTGFYSSEPAEALAELMIGHEPGGLARAFFVSSGSEAMEAALKLALQYHVETGAPERRHFIARRQSYHGNTFGALAVSGHAARRSIYEPVLMGNVSHVSPCYSYRYRPEGLDDASWVAQLEAELDAEFRRIGPGRVAGFVAETVVGATSGCVAPVPGYFRAMRRVCDRYGALLILDEVMSGMGRTGTTHAWEQEDVTPDIQTVAKGLGGGYVPIGAVLISGRVIAGLESGSGAFVHGHTYQAHPVACAGALEVQRVIAEGDLIGNVARLGPRLKAMLTERLGQDPHVGEIRGRGFFTGLELVADRETREPFDPALHAAERLKQAALAAGLAIYPGSGTIDGRRGDHVILAPAFTATEEDLGRMVAILGDAVEETQAGLG